MRAVIGQGKWSNLKHCLQIKPTRLDAELDMGRERRITWIYDGTIYWDEKDCGGIGWMGRVEFNFGHTQLK